MGNAASEAEVLIGELTSLPKRRKMLATPPFELRHLNVRYHRSGAATKLAPSAWFLIVTIFLPETRWRALGETE